LERYVQAKVAIMLVRKSKPACSIVAETNSSSIGFTWFVHMRLYI